MFCSKELQFLSQTLISCMVLSKSLKQSLSLLMRKMDDNTHEDQQYACKASAEIGKWGCPMNGYLDKLYFIQPLSQCAMAEKSSKENSVKPDHPKSAYLALISVLQYCPKLVLSFVYYLILLCLEEGRAYFSLPI